MARGLVGKWEKEKPYRTFGQRLAMMGKDSKVSAGKVRQEIAKFRQDVLDAR